MNKYWDKRFRDEGKIWGDKPSRTAEYALGLFRKDKTHTLLVPGAGYGRNTKLFSSAGMSVTGVEISPLACKMAGEFDPASRFYNTSSLDMTFIHEVYDGLYCFNVMHLFREKKRHVFIGQCAERTKSGGLLFFTVFSEKEPSYSSGEEVENNTFESKPGRPVHYFTEEDLRQDCSGLDVLETGLLEDPENHGEGPHIHILRYIYLRNSSKQ